MPDCFVFAELNGKLRSEAPSQQVTFHPLMMNLCAISWFGRESHESAGAGSVFWLPPSAPQCFQLLHVRWWKTGTASLKQEQHKKVSTFSQGDKPKKDKRAHEPCNHHDREPSQGWTNHCTNSFTLLFSGKENADSTETHFFFLYRSFALPLPKFTVLCRNWSDLKDSHFEHWIRQDVMQMSLPT